MKAYIINTGELHVDANLLHAHTVIATKSNPLPLLEWRTIPTYAVLIDSPISGWVLYDTGCAPDAPLTWPQQSQETCFWTPVEGATMVEQLTLLGLTPGDISHVILSHFHMDHTGNIGLFAETATCWVAAAEADFAFKNVMRSTDASTHGPYLKKDVLAPFADLRYVENDEEILPGIHAVLLPGHTPGCLGIVFTCQRKTIMCVGDALDTRHSYEGAMTGSVWSTLDWRNSLQKVKRIEHELNVDEIWFGHDAEQFEAFPKLPSVCA